MRTRRGAVDDGNVGRARVLPELLHPWPRMNDRATDEGARGGEAAAVLAELSQQLTPRTGTRDGKVGIRVRCDGVATEVVHRGHLLPRSVFGPLFGHGCSLRRGRVRGQLVFRHVFVPPGTFRLTTPTSIESAGGGRLIHGPAGQRKGQDDLRVVRMRPSWTTDTTRRPSWVNTWPRARPRAPVADGDSCA